MRRLTRGAGLVLLVALLVLAVRAIRIESARYRVDRVPATEMPPSLPTGTVALASLVPAGRLELGDVIIYRHPSKPDERVYLRVGEISRIPRSTGYVIRLDSGEPAREPWHTELYGLAWRVEASVALPAFLERFIAGTADDETGAARAALPAAGLLILAGGAALLTVGGWYRSRPARIGRSYRPDLW